MKQIIFSSIIALFLLSACTNMNGEQDARPGDERTAIEQTRYNNHNHDNRTGENRYRMTNQRNNYVENSHLRNGEYEGSREAAEAITREIPEINEAHVIIMGSDAYVAAMFDGNNRQNRTENNNHGYTDDRGNVIQRNATDENRTIFQGRNNGEANRGNDNRDGTRRGNNNMDENEQLTDDLRGRIAQIVREEHDTVTNVYVTTDPEFSNLTRDYMDDLDNGRPVRGFFDQIGSMIERVFPQNQR